MRLAIIIIIIITLHHQDHDVLFSQAGFVISKIKNTFYFFFFPFNQNVLLCLPHQATSVLHLLEPWIATILLTIAAAASVLRASHSHVLLTQPLELDSGSQHFALQKAVAAKVSGGDSIVLSLFHEWEDGNAILSGGEKCPTFSFSSNTPCHRCGHLTKLPWQLPKQSGEDRYDTSGGGTDHLIAIHCI